MSATTVSSTPVLSVKTIEDWLPVIGIVLGAAANAQLSNIIPGVPGVVFGFVVAAFAKSIIGLGQNPSFANWEDVLLFLLTTGGIISASFLSNPNLVIYGTVLGWLVKSLGMFQTGFNVEDIVLFIFSLSSAYAAYSGNMSILEVSQFFGILSKTLPSIGTGGAAGNPSLTKTPAKPVVAVEAAKA